jgi:hypothetical protein
LLPVLDQLCGHFIDNNCSVVLCVCKGHNHMSSSVVDIVAGEQWERKP